ncbi:hypothetical protein Q75_04930 [Bacillus coahuilensis p1.1.43]|uniref:Alpha/beta hydrolase fold-5 domain-containing protein n=1 Tax=Bacillus coahuilensis p1.1.43 TaxID=1150625 RepID=A0A147KA65_9BACI|nr:alpha/beta hydrolase [Bacillus coahuilensis]KUP07579.1 hypothetical protein Q75_04930 [Bacillus coahuilensis p1.1.43]
MKKWLKWFIILLFAFILFGGIGFYLWATDTYEPTEEALLYVEQRSKERIVFGNDEASIGFIFYPGAKVEKEAYSYLGVQLKKQNIMVVIPDMPLNLAILGTNKAEEIIMDYPSIEEWYIGGHSLGGAAASTIVLDNNKIKGIIYLASYPVEDMSTINDLPSLSISASLDGLATSEEMEEKNKWLSSPAEIVVIDEGNHANFGMYGPQKGDRNSPLTSKEQIDLVTEEIISWITIYSSLN